MKRVKWIVFATCVICSIVGYGQEKIDFSKDSSQEKKPVITELMANIFINQSKYDQAIEIFEKLILKNPEKKDYFAAKIEETEKLK